MKQAKKITALILIFILTTILLFGCFDSNKCYIGDSQSYKGLKITVNSVSERDYYITSSGYKKYADEDKVYIDIELTVENNSKTSVNFYSSDFCLLDKNKMKEESVNYIFSLDDNLLKSEIKVYETVTGIVRFYVSKTFAENQPVVFKYGFTDFDVSFLWKDVDLEWILSKKSNA